MPMCAIRHHLLAAVAMLALAACTPERDADVVARVDGAAIGELDLRLAIERLTGREADAVDPATRRRVLDSLVRSKAIARHVEAGLSAEARQRLERRVAAYREERLVQRFVERELEPEAVTGEMIRAYYERNPERFGAETVQRFESISVAGDVPVATRNQLIEAMDGARDVEDWSAWVEGREVGAARLVYRRMRGSDADVSPRLRGLAESLDAGETSPVTFIRGRPALVRSLGTERTQPAPLAEVRRRIRRLLGPVQIRRALGQKAEPLLRDSEVTYLGEYAAGENRGGDDTDGSM